MRVVLKPYEVEVAVGVGMRRQMEAIRKGKRDAAGYQGDGWSIHIQGAAGEMAAAKALGIYWDGSVNTGRDPDLQPGIQVRTRSGFEGRTDLIVRPRDKDDEIFVLVIGATPEFEVAGWIRGEEAKREEWKQFYGNRPPAFFVPPDELWNIESLKQEVSAT